MIISQKIMEAGKNSKGHWNNQQIRALGFTMNKGWYKRIVGAEATPEQIEKFLSLRKESNPKKEKRVYKIGDLPRLNLKQRKRLPYPCFITVEHDIPFKKQYDHPNWQKIRLYILDRYNYTCNVCGSQHNTLQVHHNRYLPGRFIWEVPIKYLEAVCDQCHGKLHGRKLSLNK